MQVEPRIDLAKATLAAYALAALANRFRLHWCSLTLADAATGVLVAATAVVAGLRPGVNALLCAAWALWGALCLAMLFMLRPDHIGAEVIVALSFCAVLAFRRTNGRLGRLSAHGRNCIARAQGAGGPL
jgi:hypothetical protein